MTDAAFTIYEKHAHADAYALNGGTVYTPYAIIAVHKRFSDAELAAEFEAARCDAMLAAQHGAGTYWAPLGETWANDKDSAYNRALTLLRFGTAAHFDE